MTVLAARLVCLLHQIFHYFPASKKHSISKFNFFCTFSRNISILFAFLAKFAALLYKKFKLKLLQSCNWQVKIKKRREEGFTLIYK